MQNKSELSAARISLYMLNAISTRNWVFFHKNSLIFPVHLIGSFGSRLIPYKTEAKVHIGFSVHIGCGRYSDSNFMRNLKNISSYILPFGLISKCREKITESENGRWLINMKAIRALNVTNATHPGFAAVPDERAGQSSVPSGTYRVSPSICSTDHNKVDQDPAS